MKKFLLCLLSLYVIPTIAMETSLADLTSSDIVFQQSDLRFLITEKLMEDSSGTNFTKDARSLACVNKNAYNCWKYKASLNDDFINKCKQNFNLDRISLFKIAPEIVCTQSDLLLLITEKLMEDSQLEKFGQDVRSLACVNKATYNWWKETAIKDFPLIDKCQRHFDVKTSKVMYHFRRNDMVDKIKRLFTAARRNQDFNEEDLKDFIAVNAKQHSSLLRTLLDDLYLNFTIENVDKLKMLLSSKILLTDLADDIMFLIKRRNSIFHAYNEKYFLPLIQTLLNRFENVDYRISLFEPTLFMKAAELKDDSICYLLLRKGANPSLFYLNIAVLPFQIQSFLMNCPLFQHKEALYLLKEQFIKAILSGNKEQTRIALKENPRLKKDLDPTYAERIIQKMQMASDAEINEAVQKTKDILEPCMFDAFDCAKDQKDPDWLKRLIAFVEKEKTK